MIGLLIRGASMLGFSVSPLLAGAAVAGAITLGIGVYTMKIYNAGYASCDNSHLLKTIKEKDRQIAEGEKIQQRDAERAAKAETELRKNQEAINATPPNPAACLDPAAAGRVRNVR